MKKFLGTWIADCVALIIADGLLDQITFADNTAIVATAAVLALLNMFIKPVLKVISIPITVMTFGLFSLIINGLVIMMAFNISEGSTITGLWPAILTSFIVSIVSSVINGKDK
jgi:putative membrane protein